MANEDISLNIDVTGLEDFQTTLDHILATNQTSASNFHYNLSCTAHQLSNIFVRQGDDYVAVCEMCNVSIVLPKGLVERLHEALPAPDLDSAGMLLGRAMTLDDEEGLSGVLGSLNELQTKIEKELKRHNRVLKFIRMARDIVANRAIGEAGSCAGEEQ